MIKLKLLLENTYTGWVRPSIDSLKQEFRVEHELKGHSWFADEAEFLEAAGRAKTVTITPAIDRKIGYRSGTKTYDALVKLLQTYKSWGKYRSEEKLQNMYSRLRNNLDMDMPIVLKFPDGGMRVFGGNTRMDIAFQLGIDPKVLMIEVPA
jgi:hypothetical protein